MNRKLYLAYILFSLAAFCAATGLSAYRFIHVKNMNLAEAVNKATSFKTAVMQTYQVFGSLESPEAQADLKRTILASSMIRVAAVHSSEGLLYLYAADRTYLGFSADLQDFQSAEPKYRYNSFFERRLSQSFYRPLARTESGSPGGEYTVDIVYSVIAKDALYLIIRDALISYSSLFILTCIFIIISSAARDRLPLPSRDTEQQNEGPSEQDTGPPQHETQGRTEPPPQSAEAGTRGMYSPESGLGWMQYLEDKITFELRRAASFDQDLVLILLTSSQIKRGEGSYSAMAKRVLDQFKFQDLAFEYTERGFAIIVPNTDLDQMLTAVRNFSSELKTWEVSPPPVIAAGLTSRNGRLLAGGRILMEAKKALHRAEEEGGNSIIGFRPDPVKYRQYIASKT